MIPIVLLQSSPPANLGYLFAAFAVAWAVFFAYMFFVSRRQQEMRQEIERLRQETEGETTSPAEAVPESK